jgi:VWFA-related protein
MKGLASSRSIILMTLGLISFGFCVSLTQSVESAKPTQVNPKGVRVVTIPVSTHNRGKHRPEEGQSINFAVRENGEEQKVLSIRDIGSNPLALAILIQDDLVSGIANEIKPISAFIRSLPKGSRVMVGYMKGGSLEVRQKFTTDLEHAAGSLRIPVGFQSAAPASPYLEIRDGLKKFDSLPAGRRAMLVVSDGLDTRGGLDSTSPGLNPDLQTAINTAQRKSVAVYSIYAPTVTSQALRSNILASNGQGSLAKLSEETGGRIFAQGLDAPVSFEPFLDNFGEILSRQFAITFLSTHPKNGFHRIELTADRNDIQIAYPHGYSY